MKIILMVEDMDVRAMVAFALEQKFKAVVIEASSPKDYAAVVKKESGIALAIIDVLDPTTVFFRDVGLPNADMPCVLSVDEAPEKNKNYLKNVLGTVARARLVDDLYVLISKLIQDGKLKIEAASSSDAEKSSDQDLCRIRTDLLIRVSPLKADIYIKLSEKKYVRLFQEGDVFDKADLEKYMVKKNVRYMYLRSNQTSEFIEKFKEDLFKMLARNNLTMKEVGEVSESVHETVQELISTLGMTPEVQEVVKANVHIAMKLMNSNPRLADILSRLTKDKTQYISTHSMMLGNLACSLAAAMHWSSETTYFKLNLAAFLHDISLKNNELAAVQTLQELEMKKLQFTDEEIQAYKTHPFKGSELAKQFNEIPPDVDTVIMQHHEQPDGTGFPRAAGHSRINPLSTIFIVAHDLLLFIYKSEGNWKMENFIKTVEEKYSQGNFKKVLKILGEIELTA